MSSWRECKLAEITSILGDGLHGTPKYDEKGEYFFINGNNLSNGKIIIKSDTKRASISEYTKYKKNLNDRTILVSINGTLGNIALYNDEKCILGKSACYFNVNDDVDKYFIKYVVTNNDFQEYIRNFATGTTIPNVSLKTMREYSFFLPALEEQKAIAEVLSSLDDKIDLLHRQNQTLEDLAQTLFRQWFIEETKEEWEEVTLSDVMELKYGKDHKHLNDGEIPIYGSGGIMRYGDTAIYDKESILIPRKGTLSNIFYVDEPFWTVDTIFWSKINSEKISGKLLFEFLKTLNFSNMNVGSAVPSLTTKVLNEISFALPSLKEQEEFKLYADNAWDKITQNKEQIQTLENLRDILSPKLLSREVRLEE